MNLFQTILLHRLIRFNYIHILFRGKLNVIKLYTSFNRNAIYIGNVSSLSFLPTL